MVFIINNKDFGRNVIAGEYEVNLVDDFVSWRDGNAKTHRKRTASKIKGKIGMYFKTAEDYDRFKVALDASARDDMTHLITLSVNNTNSTNVCEAFVNYALTRTRLANWDDCFEKFTLEIEEA